MKIPAYKIYLPIFIVLLLLQLYLPSFKANILLQLVVLCGFAVMENLSFSTRFLKMLVPFAGLLFIGFISTAFNRYHLYNILKDIFHFLKPLTGLLIGYIVFRRVNDYGLFVKSIIFTGIISSVIHLFIVFVIVGATSDIEDIREFTKDNFLDLFALIFLVFYKKFFGQDIIKSKLVWRLTCALLTISCILYFSRMMIVITVLVLLSVYGFTKITKTTLQLLAVVTVLGVVFVSYLQTANIKRGADGIEGFMYKIKNAPAEVFKTHVDRENHRDLWDHWRGYEAYRAYMLMVEKPYSFVVGTGHGSLVNLKFYAPLSKGDKKGMRYISELHNGYMYIIYKVGLLGLLVYLIALFKWYMYIYRGRSFNNVLISAIGIIYITSTLTISGMYNGRDIIIMLLGAALFFSEPLPQKTNDLETKQTA